MKRTSPCGRDHRAFRSYYAPTRNTVDGDLCEGFQMLPFDKQLVVAQELERVLSRLAESSRNYEVYCNFVTCAVMSITYKLNI